MLNVHGRRVVFKRQQYWFCKRLQINIFENKKVCTNWVRRILLTDVAYDIIKVFRENNNSFRRAKLESYIQFQIKKVSKESILLDFFRSRVDDVFMFKTYAYESTNNMYKLWVELNQAKLNLVNARCKVNFGEKILNKLDISHNKYIFSKKLLFNNRKSLRSSNDFLSICTLPYYDSFRIRSFQSCSASWEVSEVFDRIGYKRLYDNKIGKAHGYRYLSYSSGPQFYHSLVVKLIYLKYKIYCRLAFRYKVLNILYKFFFLKGNIIKKNLLVFLHQLSYNDFNYNKFILSMFLNLCVRFNKNRLLKIIHFLRMKNIADCNYINTNRYRSVARFLNLDKVSSTLKSYQNFFVTRDDNAIWYLSGILKRGSYGSTDVVNMLSDAYYNIQAELRYEDFDLSYSSKSFKYVYYHFLKMHNNSGIKFFVKWYYLYMMYNKYLLLLPREYTSFEYNRRIIIRSLELYSTKNVSDIFSYNYLLRYLCEGPSINITFSERNKKNNILFKKYVSSSSRLGFFNLKNLLSRVYIYPFIPSWYVSYNYRKQYNLKTLAYYTSGMYAIYYSIFNELRLAYILYKDKYFLQFTVYHRLLFIDTFFYLRYRIMEKTSNVFLNTNLDFSICFYKNFKKLIDFDVGLNYNLLSFFINKSFKRIKNSLNTRELLGANFFYEKLIGMCSTLFAFRRKKNVSASFLKYYFDKFFPSLSFVEFEFSMWHTLENFENIKLFDKLICSRELEVYRFKDADYSIEEEYQEAVRTLSPDSERRKMLQKKYIRWQKLELLKGTYESRPISCIYSKETVVPSVYTLYYTIYKFFFYIYFSRLTLRFYHGNGFLENWSIFMYWMFFRLKEFNTHLRAFEEDISIYRRVKFEDDDLFYGFSIYKYLCLGILKWRDFRRFDVFIKNREYLFLINSNINNYHEHEFKKFEVPLALNVFKLYGYDSVLENSVIYRRKVFKRSKSRLVVPRNFYKYRSKFKGYGDYDTLQYIAEITDDNVRAMAQGGVGHIYTDNFVFEGIVMGDTFYHDRYLEEYRFYYCRYKTFNSFLESYFIETPCVSITGVDEYSKIGLYIDENKENRLEYVGIFEDYVRDSRDFFNPILDLYTLYADSDDLDNFVHTRASSLYTYYLSNPSIFYFNRFIPYCNSYFGSINVYSKVVYINNYRGGVLYRSLFYSLLSPINFDFSNKFILGGLHNELAEGGDLKFFYALTELLNFGNYLDVRFALYIIAIYIPRFNYKKGAIDYIAGLKSKFLVYMGTLVRLDLGMDKALVYGNISVNHVELLKDFYLHLNFSDFGSLDLYRHSKFWIINIWHFAMSSFGNYYRHKKKYYLWWFLYMHLKKSKFLPIDYYAWFLKTFNANSSININLLHYKKIHFNVRTKAYINYTIPEYLDECLILSNWLHYWVKFFKFNILNLNFVSIIRYFFEKVAMDDSYNNLSINIKYNNIFKYWIRESKYLRLHHSIFIFLPDLKLNIVNVSFAFYIKSYIYKYTMFFMNQLCILGNLKNIFNYKGLISLFLCKIYRHMCIWIFNMKTKILNIDSIHKHIYENYLLKYYKLDILLNDLYEYFGNLRIDDYIMSIKSMLQQVQIVTPRVKILKILEKRHEVGVQYLSYIYTLSLPHIRGFSFNISNKAYELVRLCSRIFLKNVTFIIGGFYITRLLLTYGMQNNLLSNTQYRNSMSYPKIKNLEAKALRSNKHTYEDYLAMFEHPNPIIEEPNNLVSWYNDHYFVKFESRRYYSKFWYRYVPRDIVHIQRYRRFQQEIRRLIANRKKLRTGIIYRRLLMFKLVPGVFKEWHKLHVRRPYIREQFEDRVRFFYILKYKYHITRRRIMSSLYNRFNSVYTLHKAYHLLYFRLDNILFKLSFIPTFHFLRNNWILKFWNISINTISDVSYVQKSLIIGDMFFLKSGLHITALTFRKIFHTENNLYLVYLLWFRLNIFVFDLDLCTPTEELHSCLGRCYLWYWYRLFSKMHLENFFDYERKCKYFYYKMMPYGFWAHNFLKFREFKQYMVITSMDSYVRWFASSMCGFVYREPSSGFFYGLHYGHFYCKESGSFGGHLRHSSIYK